MRDIKDFHDAFYFVPNKGKQDAFILKFCREKQPNSKRKKVDSLQPRTTQFEYTICNLAGVNMNVCRDTFLNVLNITKHRVLGVFKRFKSGLNQVPTETRGGDRKEKLFEGRKEAVINFIKQLKSCESHYARGKTNRLYLPSELNISKLCKMFNESITNELQVKESYFRQVFSTNFNIGFSAPSVDECSTCLELQQRMNIEKDETEKSELTFKLMLHKKQAKCFFDHLKEKPDDCIIVSFDCQKNLVLPKVSDQIAYYSRQLYCYNLSVVTGISTDSLIPDNVSIYSWMENEAKKSSNEVASVVFNELNNINLENYSSVRLVADGCAGQNKNVNVLCMCGKWLTSYAPEHIKKIELIYPITGHSFLPSDRVFGLIERELKHKKTIINKEEYHKVFHKYGCVKLIEKDWVAYNWKEEAKMCMKSANQLHFKISQCRRVSLRKSKRRNVLVKGELSYNLDTGRERMICKAGKTFEDVNPLPIPLGVKLKPEKVKDVDKLLTKHFGNEWKTLESLQWFVSVINKNNDLFEENANNCQQEAQCECIQLGDSLDEDVVLIAV